MTDKRLRQIYAGLVATTVSLFMWGLAFAWVLA